MLQEVKARNEQVQTLNDVSDRVEPAPLNRVFAANAVEERSAQRYAAQAERAANPNALTAENLLNDGAEVFSRLLGLEGRSKAPTHEVPTAKLPDTARVAFDLADTDLEGAVNGGERFKIASRAADIAASREASKLKNDPVAEQAAERAAKDNQFEGLLGATVRAETTYLSYWNQFEELRKTGFEALANQKPAAETKVEKQPALTQTQTHEEMVDLSANAFNRDSQLLGRSAASVPATGASLAEMSGPATFNRATALSELVANQEMALAA